MSRLAEAQTLHDAMNDPLFRPALEEFVQVQLQAQLELLVRTVRQPTRDTMKEARIAGKAEAYEELLDQLTAFAKNQMERASQ